MNYIPPIGNAADLIRPPDVVYIPPIGDAADLNWATVTITVGLLSGSASGTSTVVGTLAEPVVPIVPYLPVTVGRFIQRRLRRVPISGSIMGRAQARASLIAVGNATGSAVCISRFHVTGRAIHQYAAALAEDDFWLMAA